MTIWWLGLRHAARRLMHRPFFTAAAVLIVALGIGANTMVFSFLSAALLRPLPYDRPERLVFVSTLNREGGAVGLSIPDFIDAKESVRSFSSLAISTVRPFNLRNSGDEPRQVFGSAATPEMFALLGVRMQAGRPFRADEATAGHDRVAVLSHGLWHREFNGDPAIINRTITLDHEPYTIVGVTRADSMPLDSQLRPSAELWVPLVFTAADRDARVNRTHLVLGRLRDDATAMQADAELRDVSRRLERDHPITNTRTQMQAMLLNEYLVSNLRSVFVILQAAVIFVLLIVCANLSNLLLARSLSRIKQVAIQVSLGASRLRVAGDLFAENAIIFAVGMIVAFGLAAIAIRLMVASMPFALPSFIRIEFDWRVALFTAVLVVAAAFVSALAPAVLLMRANVNEHLKEGTGDTPKAAGRSRVSALLVTAETALAVVLLVGAGLMIRSLVLLQRVDPGFPTANLITFELSLPESRYARDEMVKFYRNLSPKLEAIPGLRHVAWSSTPPFSGRDTDRDFSIEGLPADGHRNALFRLISPGYFKTMGIAIKHGRELTPADEAPGQHSVVINETMAEMFWPGRSPLGARIRRGQSDSTLPWMTVVGVAADIRFSSLERPPMPEMFVPFPESPRGSIFLVARVPDGQVSLVRAVQEAIWSLDRDLPVSEIRTMEQMVDATVGIRRLITWLLTIFGGLAIVLAALGIYSVVAHATARRTREIGLRVALGATRAQIIGLVFRDSGRLVLGGLIVGGVLAAFVSRALRGLLYGVTPADVPTFGGVLVWLVACAALAVYLPARRAARLDPTLTLRAE